MPSRHPAPARDFGVTAMVAFFVFGTSMSGLAAVMLTFLGNFLEPIWDLNPRARAHLHTMGGFYKRGSQEERLRRFRSGHRTSSPCWVLRRDVRVRGLRSWHDRFESKCFVFVRGFFAPCKQRGGVCANHGSIGDSRLRRGLVLDWVIRGSIRWPVRLFA